MSLVRIGTDGAERRLRALPHVGELHVPRLPQPFLANQVETGAPGAAAPSRSPRMTEAPLLVEVRDAVDDVADEFLASTQADAADIP